MTLLLPALTESTRRERHATFRHSLIAADREQRWQAGLLTGQRVIESGPTIALHKKPRLLVACEFSGIVRDAFIAHGWDAWSCDIIPTERPGPHIVNDVRNVLDDGWDMMIAHPPCDFLARSGCKNWGKWQAEQKAAIEFVDLLWNAPIPMIAIENPRGVLSYKKGAGYVWRFYDDLIQPWMFGEAEKKATCLWLKGLPVLMRSCLVIGNTTSRVHGEGPGEHRKANRSRTIAGIATAMAEQWGRIA